MATAIRAIISARRSQSSRVTRLIAGFRWSKGGVPISEANGDSLEVTVDYSYFTDPVSCEVSNSVGSTNVSTLVDVQCECGATVCTTGTIPPHRGS